METKNDAADHPRIGGGKKEANSSLAQRSSQRDHESQSISNGAHAERKEKMAFRWEQTRL